MLRKGQKSKILDSRFSRIRVRDRRENDDPVISQGVRRGEPPHSLDKSPDKSKAGSAGRKKAAHGLDKTGRRGYNLKLSFYIHRLGY